MKLHGKKINDLLKSVKIPQLYIVEQVFEDKKIIDIDQRISEIFLKDKIKKSVNNMRIAIAVGSRGIAELDTIVKSIIKNLKNLGANPFIIPAMGSHGGATAEGQIEVLRKLNITEKNMKVPIKASMEVETINGINYGSSYIGKYAYEADGLVVVNRVKSHTLFKGEFESGIAKMLAIGLGNQKGAEQAHAQGNKNLSKTIMQKCSIALENLNMVLGIAIIENAYGQIYKIEPLMKDEILEKEPVLLSESKRIMPSLKFESLDLLIVDEIGKNISGSGMDPNITNSFSYESEISREKRPKRIVVLSLTDKSYGSASGVGQADFITSKLYSSIDCDSTYMNAITSGVISNSKIPIVLNNEELAIKAAIKNLPPNKELRIMRIKNTSELRYVKISKALLLEAKESMTDIRFV